MCAKLTFLLLAGFAFFMLSCDSNSIEIAIRKFLGCISNCRKVKKSSKLWEKMQKRSVNQKHSVKNTQKGYFNLLNIIFSDKFAS